MNYILNIDTATEHASVCISQSDTVLAMRTNADQKNHASFIQPAIAALVAETGISLNQLAAVAVTGGPGSYTGIRVGMATAKGICYTLNKPLIIINTLEVMAFAATQQEAENIADLLYCPLIDARRMEVFTAIYDHYLTPLLEPQPMVVESQSFATFLQKRPILFFGSGMEKLKEILRHPNALFKTIDHDAGHLSLLAHQALAQQAFANLAYSEPIYLKAFFDPLKK